MSNFKCLKLFDPEKLDVNPFSGSDRDKKRYVTVLPGQEPKLWHREEYININYIVGFSIKNVSLGLRYFVNKREEFKEEWEFVDFVEIKFHNNEVKLYAQDKIMTDWIAEIKGNE